MINFSTAKNKQRKWLNNVVHINFKKKLKQNFPKIILETFKKFCAKNCWEFSGEISVSFNFPRQES
jgi:hypothetical protein